MVSLLNKACVFFVLLMILSNAGFACAKVIYVDGDASGVNDGSSWQNAYKYLQDALADAESGDEIRIAQGIYKPDQGAGITPGDRTATFQLINGVTIKGGYAGFRTADPNARDIKLYETVLSGDLAGNDVDVSDPCDLLHEPTRADNSYHVLTDSTTSGTATLDGFTITGGYANESSPFPSPQEAGGGMYNESGSPTITSCTFRKNSANYGGAIYNRNGNSLISHILFDRNFTFTVCWGDVCSPGTGSAIYNDNSSTKVENCTFTHNSTTDGPGGAIFNDRGTHTLINCIFIGNSAESGGAIYNSRVTNLALKSCLFTENSAGRGGAVVNELSTVSLMRCTFSSNSAGMGGGMSNGRGISIITDTIFNANLGDAYAGGIYNYQTDATITNCTFTGNQARRRDGGAIQNERCIPTITNCTITGNRAGQTGGGVCNRLGGNAILQNCILWDNMAPNGPQISLKETYTGAEPSTITVFYSAVQGSREAVYVGSGCSLNWLDGNVDVEPSFVESGYWDANDTPEDANDDFWIDGDYHLKSQAGRWDSLSADWVKDNLTSPCIDAGDPASPIGLEPFPNGGRINMGAYGGTREASKSYFGEPVCETTVAGDINGDCKIDFIDLVILARHWLEER